MTPQRLRGGKQDEVTLGDRAPRRRPPCAELGCQGALTRQGSGDMERGHRGGPSASPVPLEGGRTKTPRERAPDASSAWPGKEAFYFSSVLFCNCHGGRVGWGGVGVEQPGAPWRPCVGGQHLLLGGAQRAVSRFLGRPHGQIQACHAHLAV